MKVNISQILANPDYSLSVDFNFTIPDDAAVEALGADSMRSPLTVSGHIANEDGLPTLTYSIAASYNTRCDRCGEAIEPSAVINGSIIITTNPDDDGELYYAETPQAFDFAEFALEFTALEVPTVRLCDENCKGLCVKCGANLNRGECSCPKQKKNSAFDILDGMFEDNQ
ncbi:hypothetical protein FACS1894105_03570 [Clostridia bacterium]|nr:hypothetical protein FACS1894105_03570 [Clostridia bacterium]